MATVVAVRMVTHEFTIHPIKTYLRDKHNNEIHKVACKLFDEMWDGTSHENLEFD